MIKGLKNIHVQSLNGTEAEIYVGILQEIFKSAVGKVLAVKSSVKACILDGVLKMKTKFQN